MPDDKQNNEDMKLLEEVCEEAGQIALRWFGKDPEVWMKEGDSPVSEADFAVDEFLKHNLLAARPDYGWLSEETDDDKLRLKTRRTFVVDPIDGTRGFINGLDRWCVSVAIVEDHRPVVGLLECPVLKQTISAYAGQGAALNGKSFLSHKLSPTDTIRITGPRSFQTTAALTASQPVEKVAFVPSLAYRIAMVAMGEVDLTIARGSAKDWDLAAADIIALEAGARLTDLDGCLLTYNVSDVRQGPLVASQNDRHTEMVDLARRAMNKHIN